MRATSGPQLWGFAGTAIWLVSSMLLGCGHTVEQVAQKTASTAVQKTSEELAEPKNRQAMVEFWSNPALQTAARQLAASATDGTLDALTEPQRAQRIAEVSGQYMEAVAQALTRGIGKNMAPQLAALAADAVDAGVQRALSERNQAAAKQLVAELTQASARAMAVAIRDDVAPAIRQALVHDMGPGLAAMLDPNFNRAIAGTTQQIALASMVGAQRGLTGEVSESDSQQGALLGFARGLSGRALLFMKLLVWAAVLGVIGLALLIVWLRAQTRREEARIRRREAGSLFLIQALQRGDDKAWSSELRDLVRDALQDLAADPRPRQTH